MKLSRAGLSWFVAGLVFADDDPKTHAELVSKLAEEVEEAKRLLESTEGFAEFMADPEGHADFLDRFGDQDASPEKWASLFVAFGSALVNENEEEPLDDELRQVVMWRLAKIRTMLLFTRHIEDLAWRGYQNFGADVLAEALTAWDTSDKNESEEHWQTFLQDQPYLISLIVPWAGSRPHRQGIPRRQEG